MILIDNRGSRDVHINLAIEEYAMKHLPIDEHDYLFTYINRPAVVLGKNQVTLEEINHAYTAQTGVDIARRISGGGTVFHDEGNLNFSFITAFNNNKVNNFENFTKPLIHALGDIGVEAYVSERNDLMCDGFKISGTAQFTDRKKMLTHGTLLYNAELPRLSAALRVDNVVESKSIKSVRSKVTNVTQYANQQESIDTFRQRAIERIFGEQPIQIYQFSEAEWQAIEALKQEKFSQWAWVFARSPKFQLFKERVFDEGTLSLRITVEKGTIKQVDMLETPLDQDYLANVLPKLEGVDLRHDKLSEALQQVNFTDFEGLFTTKQFVNFLY